MKERTWLDIGQEFNASARQRAQLSAIIERLTWEILPVKNAPAMQACAVKTTIAEFKIPKVSQVALDGCAFNRYGVYGIEGHYTNGRARIYILDKGTEVVPIASDIFKEEAAVTA